MHGYDTWKAGRTLRILGSLDETLLGLLEVNDVPDGLEVLQKASAVPHIAPRMGRLTSGLTFLYWR